jgi:uncharacterized protein (UPF0264 family)
MSRLLDLPQRPGLLVSVRNSIEALAALEGGAHVIDVKEPNRGSLGSASRQTIEDVIRAVDGRAPVTAAVGELIDLVTRLDPMPARLSLFKIGLARCRALPNWKSHWLQGIGQLWPHSGAATHAVAVAYADWQTAGAPDPQSVLAAAVDAGCPALLIDTYDKSSGSVFDHWPLEELAVFRDRTSSQGLMLVLAGSLVGQSFEAAAMLRPDLLAVRTAASESGRNGNVTRERVAALRQTIRDANERSSTSVGVNTKKVALKNE